MFRGPNSPAASAGELGNTLVIWTTPFSVSGLERTAQMPTISSRGAPPSGAGAGGGNADGGEGFSTLVWIVSWLVTAGWLFIEEAGFDAPRGQRSKASKMSAAAATAQASRVPGFMAGFWL